MIGRESRMAVRFQDGVLVPYFYRPITFLRDFCSLCKSRPLGCKKDREISATCFSSCVMLALPM